jgi:hypothetical protein
VARNSFGLEQLEGRALFSVFAPLDMGAVREPVMVLDAVSAPIHPLAGPFNVAGTYEHPIMPGNPDAGSHYNFTGRGRKASLGKFHFTGALTTPGFINNARSRGQFVISNGHGTITFSVVGPEQGPGALPESMNYRIRSSTGSYTGATGKGRILLSASGSTQKFLMRFNPARA